MGYEVKKGDGWYKIAKSLGVNVNDLLKANNANIDTMLHPGQKLNITKQEETPGITNNWQSIAGQNNAISNWAQQRVNDSVNTVNQGIAQKEAEEQEIQRKASQGTKGFVQQQAKANTIRLQQALLKEGYNLGRWGADGNWGNATDAAIAQAEKDGWVVNGHRLVKKPKPQAVKTNSTPQIFGAAGPEYAVMALGQHYKNARNVGTTDPMVALGKAKAYGWLGIDQNYEYPQEHIGVLSDQNQYIFDNWESAMDYNYGSTANRLAEWQKKFNEAKLANDQAKMSEYQKEIDDHNKSMKSILANKAKYKKAGGLKEYLIANPNEKVVIGGNFRFYKDGNKSRFPEGTPTGYASFDRHPNYVGWARNAPLGQVETIYGNNVHSWVYNPETNQIETASSDEYNFNSVGSEFSSKIGQLRSAVGEDEDLAKTKIKYRSALKPIKLDGSTNYLTTPEEFGLPRENTEYENTLLDLGLRNYLNNRQ